MAIRLRFAKRAKGAWEMDIKKVLVAVDESEGAKRAIEVAESLAKPNPDMHLDLVYVAPIPLLDESQTANFKEILDMMVSDGKDILSEIENDLSDEVAGRSEALLLTGTNPATEIIKLIEQREYDMVVIGNRGLSGFKEYMGSVSHKVLNGSPVPVLVVK